MKIILSLIWLIVFSCIGFGQIPQCTSIGQAYWTPTPFLSQIYGCAGGGKTEVQLMMQGFTGTLWMSANSIEFYGNTHFYGSTDFHGESIHFEGNKMYIDGRQIYINGHQVLIGEPDSAAVGMRTLMIAN